MILNKFTIINHLLEQAHPQWWDILNKALQTIDPNYLRSLHSTKVSSPYHRVNGPSDVPRLVCGRSGTGSLDPADKPRDVGELGLLCDMEKIPTKHYLPEFNALFAAFSMPLTSVRYILFGESPYPRVQSANGYAFWDGAVGSLWSATGLSKDVNRATSLRNLIKMLLHARGDLQNDFSQETIARLDKASYVNTASQLFSAFIQHGFLLLNASLVYSDGNIPYHARQWRPFMHSLLVQLADYNPSLQLVLLGRIAALVPEASLFTGLVAEHPYNISFITNPLVVDFFKPMDLLNGTLEDNAL